MKYIGKLKSIDKIIDSLQDNVIYAKEYLQMLKNLQNDKIEIKLLASTSSVYTNGTRLFEKDLFESIEEIPEYEIWKPKTNESFFYQYVDGSIYVTKNDTQIVSNYNSFETKEQTENISKMQKLQRAQECWRLKNDNVELDWINYDKGKYYIQYLHQDKTFKVYCNWYLQSLGVIYFSTENKAKQCLEWLKNEALL